MKNKDAIVLFTQRKNIVSVVKANTMKKKKIDSSIARAYNDKNRYNRCRTKRNKKPFQFASSNRISHFPRRERVKKKMLKNENLVVWKISSILI